MKILIGVIVFEQNHFFFSNIAPNCNGCELNWFKVIKVYSILHFLSYVNHTTPSNIIYLTSFSLCITTYSKLFQIYLVITYKLNSHYVLPHPKDLDGLH